MGIFSNILEKLGIGHDQRPAPDVRPYGPKTVPAGGTGGSGSLGTTAGATAQHPAPAGVSGTSGVPGTSAGTVSAPAPISEVDVVAQLEKRAASHGEKLNWRTSIVDLMKLLDMDSSLTERKALATELGAPADVMGDSAHMNMWLHKEVLKRIAANGGNVPASMLD